MWRARLGGIESENGIFTWPRKTFESMGLSKNDVIKLTRSMRALDFSQQLKEIMCPVDIVCGEKDTANLKAAKKLSEFIPQANSNFFRILLGFPQLPHFPSEIHILHSA